jgi:MoxR-like ATPase
VLFTNNISTTKAGLENFLLDLADADALPNVLVVDEVEKQSLENLLCLNTVMSEGIITKLNARVNRRAEARFTVIAICNDEKKLREFQNGHLWSRFTHKLRCVRPSRELCLHILRQEVGKLPAGNPAWADAALAFGWDELKQRDIREIKGHLDGRDRLLSGEWQMDQLAILKAAQHEDAALNLVEQAVSAPLC